MKFVVCHFIGVVYVYALTRVSVFFVPVLGDIQLCVRMEPLHLVPQPFVVVMAAASRWETSPALWTMNSSSARQRIPTGMQK